MVPQLSPRCGFLDVVSQSGGFELFSRSFADVVSLLAPTCLPDVVSQLSPRFGFPDVGSWSGSCFAVFHLFPRCGLAVVSQMWFLDVVSLSGCCLVVFDLIPTCGLSGCLLDLVSQMLAPGLVVVSLSSTSFPDPVSQLSPRCGF